MHLTFCPPANSRRNLSNELRPPKQMQLMAPSFFDKTSLVSITDCQLISLATQCPHIHKPLIGITFVLSIIYSSPVTDVVFPIRKKCTLTR